VTRQHTVLVAHESETIREVIRHLLEAAGYRILPVPDGKAAVEALELHPDALVIDVAVGGVHAYQVVEEVRRRLLATRIVLVASIYNRTGYKRRPTSLYGADDYVEQHHIPDALVGKLARLVGGSPADAPVLEEHEDTPEGRSIRKAAERRLEPVDGGSGPGAGATARAGLVARAERLARLIVADIALYNGDALDAADRLGHSAELDARLRLDLEEGRLLFDLRVPEEVRRTRDFIGEALDELRHERRGQRGAT
jgi:CheY-like chemotaxis protein